MSSSKTVAHVATPTPRAKSTRKNSIRSRTDIGWQHGFDVLRNGKKKVKCKYFSKTISGGIFRFKCHLARNQDNVGPCASVPGDVRFFHEDCCWMWLISFQKRQMLDIERYVHEVETQEIQISTYQKKKMFVVGSYNGVQKN